MPVKANKNTELILLIFAEAEINSGLALAARLAERGGFHGEVIVVSEKADVLLEQVRGRLGKLSRSAQEHLGPLGVSKGGEELFEALDKQTALRLVLVPGLDQLSDDRRKLLKKLHTSVVCFESHPGLEVEPSGLWLVEEDEGQAATWLCEHLVAYPKTQRVDFEELRNRELAEGGGELDHTLSDLVIFSATVDNLDSRLKQSKSAVESAVGPVLLICGESSWSRWFWERQLPAMAIAYIPQMDREGRRALAEKLQNYSKLDFEFIALICASTFLAAFGLLQNSAAVIIGAMLVAPLMTPILGAGLSLAQGNQPLFFQSLRTILLGLLAAIGTSCLFGLLVRFGVPSILDHTGEQVVLTSEMWSRTNPTAIDFLVGLVGGSAAAFARTRTHLADALAGAAIAAALVPPIATAGLHLAFLSAEIAPPPGSDAAKNLVYGPILLFVANMLTIMIGSSFVLWACGLRSDHSHGRRERWSTRMTFLLLILTVSVLVWIVQHPK